MRRATMIALAGLLPLVLLSVVNVADAVDAQLDPCRTWGDQWGPVQAGGGTTAPGVTGCAGGSSWTTESRASAAFRAAWIPLGTLAAVALAVAGLERARPFPTAIAIAVTLAMSFPLTLGFTVFVAALPAIVLAAAARRAGLAPTPATIGVGIAAIAAVALLLVNGILYARGVHPIAWIAGAAYPLQLAVVGALCVGRRGSSNVG